MAEKKTREVIITNFGTKKFYFNLALVIAIPIILNLIIVPTSLYSGFFEGFLFILLVTNIICLGIVAVLIPVLYCRYKGKKTPNKVSISGDSIEFQFKKKPPIILPESEFDTIEIKVKGFPTTATKVASAVSHVATFFSGTAPVSSSSDFRTFKIYYYKDNGDKEKIIKKIGLQFYNDADVRKILFLIDDFVKSLEKNVILSEGVKKYYRI